MVGRDEKVMDMFHYGRDPVSFIKFASLRCLAWL